MTVARSQVAGRRSQVALGGGEDRGPMRCNCKLRATSYEDQHKGRVKDKGSRKELPAITRLPPSSRARTYKHTNLTQF